MTRRSLRRDSRGMAVLEFAVVAPVLLLTMMGLGELAFQGYMESVLTGAVQRAGRNAGLQSQVGQTAAIDAAVAQQVHGILPAATLTFSRQNFDNYAYMSGEPYTDTNGDGKCDNKEPYIDVNGNGSYDSDLSSAGEGGAGSTTKYVVTLTYRRLFPAPMFRWTQMATLTATTVFKNQPYSTQAMYNPTTTGKCS